MERLPPGRVRSFTEKLILELERLYAEDPNKTLRAIDTLIRAKPETRFIRLEELVETECMYKDLCR